MAKRAVRRQPETVPVAALMIAVGGFLDAYTFIWHGVFANAQSGNIVLIAVYAAQRQWGEVTMRLPSVFAYIAGLLVAHLLSTGRARDLLRRPTRVALGIEIAVLAVLGMMPFHLSTPALTVPVSFIAALQAMVFTSVGGVKYQTTMATGNLRSMISALFTGVVDRDADSLRASGVLLVLLLAFAIGAGIGALATDHWHQHASWLAVVALVVALALIVAETRRRERASGLGAADDDEP